MTKRTEHLFQFTAYKIASAAAIEAEYHEQRVMYWQTEMDEAYKRVEATMSARIQQQPITGGWRADVVVDYGDPAAYRRLNEAGNKIHSHREAAERFRTEQQIYETQRERMYDLDTDDVHHYRLGGGPREE